MRQRLNYFVVRSGTSEEEAVLYLTHLQYRDKNQDISQRMQ
ncbi:MAG: hypothetical protein ACI90V_001542, partial [Bacillariaceae sp.]